MSPLALSRAWSELRSQWIGNSRLRWGLLVIGAILAAQGLWLLGDTTQAWRGQSAALRDDIDRIRPLMRDTAWTRRVDDARQQLDAVRSMLWQAGDVGLAEAALQDWVRSVAGKTRLGIRELAVARPAAAVAAAAPSASGAAGAGTHAVTIRLVVDLNRLELMGFLAELARNEQVIVVDRLVLRPASQPPMAEIELRALHALRAEAK